jgi:catechol 1,2-dioxygenase
VEDVAKLIVGAWRLVHSIIISADGKKKYPFGEDAIGYIYYSDAGVMAVQISRSRAEVKESFSPRLFSLLVDMKSTPTSRWSAISLRGNSSRRSLGVLERKYRFDGDLLSLRPVDRTNQEILGQRVRG